MQKDYSTLENDILKQRIDEFFDKMEFQKKHFVPWFEYQKLIEQRVDRLNKLEVE